MALVEVKVPDIGDFKDVTVIELMVKPGDSIVVDQSLVTVESDKASMEIPSSHAGVVREIKVAIGDTVNQGSLLLLLETADAAADTAAAPAAPPAAATAPAAAVATAPATALPYLRHQSHPPPAARSRSSCPTSVTLPRWWSSR